MYTSVILSAGTSDRVIASLIAWAPSLVAGTEAKAPLNCGLLLEAISPSFTTVFHAYHADWCSDSADDICVRDLLTS